MDAPSSYVSPVLRSLNGLLETYGLQLILAFTLALAFSIFLRKTNAVIFTEFFRTKEWRWYAYIGGLAILFSLWYQVGLSVQFNAWYKEFYDLITDTSTHGSTSITRQWSSSP